MKKSCLAIFLILFFTVAAAENDKAFIWQVTSDYGLPNHDSPAHDSLDQAVVYLMGSIHFADKSFYPLRPVIEEAYQRAQYLVVELDINKVDRHLYTRLLSEKGVYKDGVTIKDKVSNETWVQLQKNLRRLNINYQDVKTFKPGMQVLILSVAQVTRMGFDAELGIDAYFLAKAGRQPMRNQFSSPKEIPEPKQIIELETLEQQLDLFLSIPNGDLLLQESLHSLDEAQESMQKMVRYWKQGDVAGMNKLLFEDALSDYPAFSDIYQRLFYDRNNKMAAKIENMLKQQQGIYFVVVGSGHLIGEKGIVSLLKDKGYQLKRL